MTAFCSFKAISATTLTCILMVWVFCCIAESQPRLQDTCLHYTVREKGTAVKKGDIHIRIEKAVHQYTWHETRKYQDEKDTFHVTFRPETLLPSDYERRTKSRNGTRIVRLTLEDRQLDATITEKNGQTRQQRLKLPRGTVIIEPFIKYYRPIFHEPLFHIEY